MPAVPSLAFLFFSLVIGQFTYIFWTLFRKHYAKGAVTQQLWLNITDWNFMCRQPMLTW
jgi:hypothetical protein